MRSFILPFICLSLIFLSCTTDRADTDTPASTTFSTTNSGVVVADTIIYDVLIRNPDPNDSWTSECLENLNHRQLIDSLFALAYSGNAEIYDFFSNTPVRPQDLKEQEDEGVFDRESIGKIQFTESWYFDNTTQMMSKRIISIVLGDELYDEEGLVRGYKPIFRLQLQ